MIEDMEKHFWSKVAIKSSDQCWNWKAGKDKKGYGIFWNSGNKVRAHRFAFEVAQIGFIPEGMNILHKCDNPSCCNPRHLYAGTQFDNVRDMDTRGRRKSNQNTTAIAFSHADFYAGEIWLIRKLRIPVKGYIKRHKYSQKTVAKIFRTSQATISKIWNSDKYPCKEGYYI